MKKFLCMVMLLFALSMIPSTAYAAEIEESDGDILSYDITHNQDIPVFDSIEERILSGDDSPVFYVKLTNGMDSNSRAGTGAYAKYVHEGAYRQYKIHWGYHPSFDWDYCNAYSISTSLLTVSLNISVNIGPVFNIGLGISGGGNARIYYAEYPDRLSRISVYGTVEYDSYDIHIIDSDGNVVAINENGYNQWDKEASDLHYRVVYQ